MSVELAEICDIEPYVRMLSGRIIRREKDPYALRWIYRVYMPGAPTGATTMTPIYCGHSDRNVTVQSIEWRDANGAILNA